MWTSSSWFHGDGGGRCSDEGADVASLPACHQISYRCGLVAPQPRASIVAHAVVKVCLSASSNPVAQFGGGSECAATAGSPHPNCYQNCYHGPDRSRCCGTTKGP